MKFKSICDALPQFDAEAVQAACADFIKNRRGTTKQSDLVDAVRTALAVKTAEPEEAERFLVGETPDDQRGMISLKEEIESSARLTRSLVCAFAARIERLKKFIGREDPQTAKMQKKFPHFGYLPASNMYEIG